ncbi:MAG: Rpn family recombination-promoting nuclease/putative transposase, partial [Spirochaetales bacterium]|nr:Rpn family recombination-promoting nuclease/putative transposase [Spirochaetales bacterium]
DLEVHVLELPKLRNNAKIDKRLFGWLEFFEEEEEGKNMDAVIEKNPKLTRAQELFKRFTENEELNRYEARVKYERDLKYWIKCRQEQIRNEALEEGRDEGITIGLSQGAHQAKIETAKNLINLGLSQTQIASVTGLSVDEIEKL